MKTAPPEENTATEKKTWAMEEKVRDESGGEERDAKPGPTAAMVCAANN